MYNAQNVARALHALQHVMPAVWHSLFEEFHGRELLS
jgi:hypothetical protein